MLAAASHGRVAVMAYLRQLNVPFEVTTDAGRMSALQAAIRAKAPLETIRWLVDNGCSGQEKDHDGQTPLHSAASVQFEAAMPLLIAAGARVDEVNLQGQTPLHIAVQYNSASPVKFLLQSGADLFLRCSQNRTPLLEAVRFDSRAAVRVFLDSLTLRAQSISASLEELNRAPAMAAHW